MNIVIVGGGTAGCLSTLFCQRFFPNHKIILIDDSDLGPIGVGESTTPAIIEMLDFLGISLSDMVVNCGATIKNSTRFTNWNGDNKFYHHGFNTDPELDIFYGSHKSFFSHNPIGWAPHVPFLAINELQESANLDNIHLGGILSIEDKVPYEIQEDGTFRDYSSIGLHFDARRVAEYFQRLSLERGAVHINSRVIESHVDEEGYVKSLKLANDQTVDCDFIFDCSGFLRLFVEKTYKSKFKSYKKYLPVDSAIPFFLERSGETPTYTEAIALSSGWMWKTPVDGRFGCGYVFDSNYIDKDEALHELTNLLGFEPKINKHITFESGYFETPWNKNVLAVGLSSGFLEPLEATSIWITVISLQLFIEHIRGFVNKDEKSIDEYNEQFTKSVESILALVQFHYFTKRNDSDFWREFRKKNEVVPLLQEILDIYSYRLPSNLEANKYNTFPPFSWYLVGAGLDYFEKDIINSESKSYNIKESLSTQNIYDFKNNMNTVVDRCLQHNEFLRYLRGTQ